MPFTFTTIEYADMLFVYGFCNGNSGEAAREYARRYPNRRQPEKRIFAKVYQQIRDKGTVPGIGAQAERIEGDRGVQPVVRAVHHSPNVSVRRLSARLGVSRMKVWRTLKRQGLHPYHYQRVQHLQAGDFERRLDFSAWLADHPQLSKYILYTDEAIFTRCGNYNIHNEHWWSQENPKRTAERNFQHRFSVNVWCGMIDRQLIGPYIFEGRLTGEVYTNFLRHQLPLLLEDVPLKTRQRMILQHDGAPPHYSRQVIEHLNQAFPGRWIGRGGPHAWPARSPDLTPLDFYLWGHMKTLVYKTKVNSREELLHRIQEAADQLKNNPAVLRKATQSVLERVRMCSEVGGTHFEHLM